MEHQVEEYFGEGIAKPIRLAKRVGRFCLKLLNPYYPKETLEGKIPFEDEVEAVEPMAHDLFDRRYEQPPLWKGLPYYHEFRDNHLRPDGTQAVYTADDFKRHLDG